MRARSRRFSRTSRTLAGLGLLASSVVMLFVPAGAQTDESSAGSYAELSGEGWWTNGGSVPNVPANGLPVAAQNGNPYRVSAMGVNFFISDEEVVTGLKLTLKESTAPGANFPPITEQSQSQAQSQVVIVACPIVSVWSPVENGAWADKPTEDCDQARGDGVRNHATGTWTFDLTSLAELWAFNTIEPNGILLIERNPTPGLTYQVVFDDQTTNTPLLELETELVEPEAEEEDTAVDEVFEEEIPADSGDGGLFAEIGDDVTGTPDTPFGITDTPPTTAAPEPVEEVDNTPVVNRRATKGKLPLGAFALLPFSLGLALLFGVVLGPAGDPATARRREGGLSRALARRSPAPLQ